MWNKMLWDVCKAGSRLGGSEGFQIKTMNSNERLISTKPEVTAAEMLWSKKWNIHIWVVVRSSWNSPHWMREHRGAANSPRHQNILRRTSMCVSGKVSVKLWGQPENKSRRKVGRREDMLSLLHYGTVINTGRRRAGWRRTVQNLSTATWTQR